MKQERINVEKDDWFNFDKEDIVLKQYPEKPIVPKVKINVIDDNIDDGFGLLERQESNNRGRKVTEDVQAKKDRSRPQKRKAD